MTEKDGSCNVLSAPHQYQYQTTVKSHQVEVKWTYQQEKRDGMFKN